MVSLVPDASTTTLSQAHWSLYSMVYTSTSAQSLIRHYLIFPALLYFDRQVSLHAMLLWFLTFEIRWYNSTLFELTFWHLYLLLFDSRYYQVICLLLYHFMLSYFISFRSHNISLHWFRLRICASLLLISIRFHTIRHFIYYYFSLRPYILL
jgi:hypothetical protein